MASKAGAASKKGTKAAKQTQEKASDATQDATDDATDDASGATDDSAGQGNGQGDGIFSELIGEARDAAMEVLKPVVKEAATSAAGYAAKKGPDLIKDKVGDLTNGGGIEDLLQGDGLKDLANDALKGGGPLGKVAGKLGVGGNIVGNLLPGDDDDDEDGEGGEANLDATGSGRRMPVQQSMDVAVPLSDAYNLWTQFEEYPDYMFRVDGASQDDEAHVTFTEKVWGFGRDFEAEIVEQRPDERIAWRSVNGLKHAGVVTFHELAPRLTRIEVSVDFKPESLFQKFARGARFSKRAIRSDMHRFKAYAEVEQEAEDGGWRGIIEDGEFVGWEEDQAEDAEETEGEEAPEGEAGEEEQAQAEEEPAEDEESEEGDEEEEPQAEEEEEPEAEEEEEPEAEEEEEPQAEAEEQEDEEPEEKPAPRRRRKSSGSNGSSSRSGQRRRSGQKSNGGGRKRPSSPRKPKPARTAARS